MRDYRPGEISVIFDGQILTGFAEGTFINVERDEDAYTYAPSTNGGGTRTKNSNRAGKITLTLQKSSPSNQVLSDAARRDEESNDGVRPVLVRDNSGSDLYKAESAYVVKIASAEEAKELPNREWILQCEVLEINLGGN